MADNVSGRRKPKVNEEQSKPREKGIKSSDTSVYKGSDKLTISGKKSSGMTSIHTSSEECHDYKCDPCKDAGDNAEADGFCTHCKEYLCSTCFRSHSRSKLLKHHILFGREDMPRKSQSVCNPCKTFGDEILAVGYCEDCCDHLCENCFKSHPRNKFTKNHVLVKPIEAHTDDVTTHVAKMKIKGTKSASSNSSEEYTYNRDINVKTDTDEKECYITGMTLVSNNELVLCDNDNQCLKLVDIDKNTVIDVYSLQCCPLGITTISNTQIAVVLGNKYQIQMVTTSRKLTLDRTIKTNGCCVCVQMVNNHLYVSFKDPVKLQILQPTGAIIKTIKPDDEVLKHCTLPRHIAVSPDESVIYVSDWNTNKVLSLDMNGNMVALCQEELDRPNGIIISPSGFVYVCNRKQHIVYKMTSDLTEAMVILVPGDGLQNPYAICLNTDNKHLYISSQGDGTTACYCLKVFKY